jgi:HEAT repeat protein
VAHIETNRAIAELVLVIQTDPDPQIRVNAIIGLKAFLKEGPQFAPTFTKALDDADHNVRIVASHALADLGPLGRTAVPRMLAILKDKKERDDVRWAMAIDLGKLGQCEEQAVPTLLQLLESACPLLRSGAANALGRLGSKDDKVVPALLNALKDPDIGVRGNAAQSLGHLRKDADKCVPALTGFLREVKAYRGNTDPRYSIMWALGRFGPDSRPAVSVLVEIAEDKRVSKTFRSEAITTLGEIGPAAQAAIPALRTLSKDFFFNEDATLALSKIAVVPNK